MAAIISRMVLSSIVVKGLPAHNGMADGRTQFGMATERLMHIADVIGCGVYRRTSGGRK